MANDGVRSTGHVFQNLGSGQSQNVDTLHVKPRITAIITCRSVAQIMRDTINLDREAFFGAKEINHIVTDWVLLAELDAQRFTPKLIPEKHFGE
jgi:hypothetical protein